MKPIIQDRESQQAVPHRIGSDALPKNLARKFEIKPRRELRQVVKRIANWVCREIGPLSRPFAMPILRQAYQRALKAEDLTERKKLLSRAYRWRQYVYPPGNTVLEVTKLAEDLCLWVNLCELEGGHLYFGVDFEPFEVGVVKRLVKPGDVFFDVGANIGVYSLIASRLVGGCGIVYAFEPASFAYEILLNNIKLNQASNIVANQFAVDEQAGVKKLFVNRESGLSSLGSTNRGLIIGTEEVSTTSLDDYIERQRIPRVNFLKIDVEGYEGHVLRGAKRLIERERELIILCELAQKNFAPLNLSINGVIAGMQEHGYEAWEIDRSRGLLVKLGANRESYENQNFVFVRPDTRGYERISQMSWVGDVDVLERVN